MAEFCPRCMQPVNGDKCPHCGSDVHVKATNAQLPVGTILETGISRYQIGVALGQGGFGITYIAMDLRSHQRVAVKEYFPNLCAQRGDDHISVFPKPNRESMFMGGRSSFLKEAQMLASLEKMPGIVEILNYFEINGTAYLVMEYLDGVTLKKLVSDRGSIPVQEFMPKLPPLIRSLGQIHKQNVIHRDISPDNIMLMPDGSLKLLDFGCARSMEDGRAMTVMYKPGFAPVEQYLSKGQGTWTDVYALCATIYYCITGVVPQASVDRLDNDKLQQPSALGAALPADLEAALMWGLTVQPKERPVNMEAFAHRFCPEDTLKNYTVFQTNGSNTVNTVFERVLGTTEENPASFRNNNSLLSVLPKNPIARAALLLAIAAAAVFLIVVACNGI